MNKETVSINSLSTDQLTQQRDKTLQMIEKREYHIGLIGQCKIKDGSSFENSLELGLRRADAKGRLAQDQEKLNDLNQELAAYNQAKEYLNTIKLRQTQLGEMSQMMAQGNLFPQIFEKHQNEFQELTLLPETDAVLARGIARIRQEEQKKEESQETKPTSEHKLTGKSAQLIDFLRESSPDDPITSDNLVGSLWPGVDNKTGRNNLSVLLPKTNRKLLDNGLNLKIVAIDPQNKRIGQKATYYLINNDQEFQVSQTTQPNETPKNTDTIITDKFQTSENEEIDAINKPEFGTLSCADIMIITCAVTSDPHVKTILNNSGVSIVEEDILSKLINITGEISLADSKKMTEKQYKDSFDKFRVESLQKAKYLIESPEYQEIKDEIYKKNENVWYLLESLCEINNKLKGQAKEDGYYVIKEGLAFLIDFVTDSKEYIWTYYVTDKQGKEHPIKIDRRVAVENIECSPRN